LFPVLEEELGPLTEFHRKVATTLEMVHVEAGVGNEYWFGRPVSNRKALARAFVAKAVSNAPTTKDFRNRILADPILRRVCGWEERNQVPSESTFSRVFQEFAEAKLAEQKHEGLIQRYLPDHLFGHVSQDSTEIDGREKPKKKPKPTEKPKKKRGRPKKGREDEVQLCAQAICLEEMRGIHIAAGALYYGKTRRRRAVTFDAALRELTVATAGRLHRLVEGGDTPDAVYDAGRCANCSLIEACMPRGSAGKRSVANYFERMLREGEG